MMKTGIGLYSIVTACVLFFFVFSSNSLAWERGEVDLFALLPEGSGNPEAIAVDDEGNIYVSTLFSGMIYSYTSEGVLRSAVKVAPSSGMLLDLAFHPVTGALLVVDLGAQKILEVNLSNGVASVFSEIPGGPAAGPNMLAFDKQGNVYVSDSFQGKVWRIPAHGGSAEAWLSHELLTTKSFPPYGANGIAFNMDYSALYVANTGDGTIVKVTIDTQGNAGNAEVLVNSINGPDGIIVDEHEHIWVTAHYANQVMVLDREGNGIRVLGDFDGISKNGVAKGFLSPSDLVKVGKYIYVSNFALDVGVFGFTKTYATLYTKQLRRHSISRLRVDGKSFDD